MKRIKILLHFLVCFLISFALIYLFVMFGGWKLFENGNPITYEIAAALGFGFILLLIYETNTLTQAQIKALKKRIEELESQK